MVIVFDRDQRVDHLLVVSTSKRYDVRETRLTERHLTVEEFAEREGVPVPTVYGWNSQGVGPKYMKIGRHVRYRIADVIAWENSRVVGGVA